MKKLLSVALITFAFATTPKTVSNNAVSNYEQNANNSEIVKEAVSAIKYTNDALRYISKKQLTLAKDALKKAIGELAVVLNSPKAMYLLPVDINVVAYQFNGNLDIIKKLTKQAKDLLDDNNIPKSREILNSLRDEIVIKSINLPLATYPAALNLAIKYINENKIQEAKDILSMALATLVEVDNIIPIPLIKAEALINQAKNLKNKKEILTYLKEAKNQLKLAQSLGYTSTSHTTYQTLKQDIANLEKEIKANHKTSSLFENLIQKLKEFKEKAIKQITH